LLVVQHHHTDRRVEYWLEHIIKVARRFGISEPEQHELERLLRGERHLRQLASQGCCNPALPAS
jgi:hypothetical protein